MSNYSSLKATINANVKANGNQEITGPVMNSVLNAMVDSLGTGYQYKGKAVPSTNPGTPDSKVYYLASEPGTYTNFNGIVVSEGEVAILKWDTAWSKEVTGAATEAQLTQLGQEVSGIIGGEITPEITWVDGMIYQSGRNVFVSTNANYKRSNPISVRSGDVVKFTGGNDSTTVNVLAISAYDSSTGTYSAVLLYPSTSQENIQWTAPSNMDVVISTKKSLASGDVVIALASRLDKMEDDIADLDERQTESEGIIRMTNPPKRYVYGADYQINDIYINPGVYTSAQLASVAKGVLYNKFPDSGGFLVGILFRDSSNVDVIDGRVLCATEAEADELIASGFVDLPNIKYTFVISANASATTYNFSIGIDTSVFAIENSPYIVGLLNREKLPSEQLIDVPSETGKYIDSQGVVHTTSLNYKITSPISLCPGDILKISAKTSSTMSVLSKVDGANYLPIFLGRGTGRNSGYGYTAKEYCDVVVCYLDNALLSIVRNAITLTPALVKIPHYYVAYASSRPVYTSSTSYGISKPIKVYKNDRLRLSIQANDGVTAVLSLCDAIGEKLNPIFAASGSAYTSYEYIVQENGYVAVSGNFSSTPAPELVITRQANRPNFDAMLADTKYEYARMREKYFYSESEDNAIPENYNTILCYDGDTKSNDHFIVNAVAYPDGTIIACRAGGSVVKIAKDGTETTLLTINGAGDWRGVFIDTNNNVYVSPHNTIGGTGSLPTSSRGLYRLPYGGDTFTKVISLYDPNSSVTTETQSNDDTIWTMCEDNFGRLYAGVYAHSVRANPSIYRSDDGGQTWTMICNFIEDGIIPATTRFGNPMHIHCIIFNQYNGALYCLIGEVETVFKSIDGGETWEDLHILTEDEKGTSLIAVPDGILLGSDGARRGVISKIYSDDRTTRTTGIMWHAEFFGMRRSDVTGWIYAFTKIESTIGSATYYPPIEANTDPNALATWEASASAANLAAWERYHNWVSAHYTHDSIHPTMAAILVSRDNGESWEIIYAKDTKSGAGIGLGIFCVGYFRNGECLCSMSEEVGGVKKFVNPVIISEGKHKYTENGIDLSGDIFVKTNQSNQLNP